MNNQTHRLPTGIMVVAVLTVIFGLAEVITSFRHEFFGLTTSQATISTIIGATIGCLYFTSGLLVLTKRKKAAVTAIVFLCIDAAGRILMVLTGLYPMGVGYQTFGIVTGTTIVILFAVYIGVNLKKFS